MKIQIQNFFKGNYHTFYTKYLPNAKQIGGDEYQALCPFHEDSKPSFNFNNATGAYYCHGCGKKGDFIHFYAKLHGLNTKSDFGKILKGIASDFGISIEEQKTHIVKTYDYTNETGTLLFQVCRMDPKDFRQRHRNGNGWIWNLKDVRRVIYNLPAVLKASGVFIVEGEKDCDNLSALGLTATCNPMGAGKWLDEYSESLRGKDVVLLPDNDNRGREHMVKVGQSLQGLAKSIKWLDLPDLPSRGDVSDFLSKFDDKVDAQERLAILIAGAEIYNPPKQVSVDDIIIDASSFIQLDIPERKALLHPWLKESAMILGVGDRGCGKSFFALGICDAVTKESSFGAWECKRSVPSLFLDGEMTTQDVADRIKGLRLDTARQNPLYVYSDAYANQHGLPRAHLANESWRVKMKSILIAKHVKLWVIDNLASLASGLDENSKKEWDPINQWLLELRFAGITTLMLHHTGKSGTQRGTSAREDNIDISFTLKRPSDYTPEDGAKFIVHFTKARVSTKDLQLIADTQFKLLEDETGVYSWDFGDVRKENRLAVLEMISEGMDQKTICDTLGLSKGYVSKVKKKLLDDGHISKKGEITQSGFSVLHGL
ncbi:conserved hypothetical protein [uncultured Desulfobacterium sp.]|uniref:Zinc finger CHC2-type domain-containing protein n=1 Tax=uncultured Desulfobacterium sp. TaxID=201089 RepID=A0A445MXG5_9BACT|nr:conserved hypothetical protein [uncultured Desulfobacterium sp.]